MLINETERISDCVKSLNVISLRTILENHPFVKDVDKELERINKENKENTENTI
jgi:hypothetical protein